MERGSDVVEKSESFVKDNDGHFIGKDTTAHHRDGSSTVTHQTADMKWGSVDAGRITGTTRNTLDGKSTYKKS